MFKVGKLNQFYNIFFQLLDYINLYTIFTLTLKHTHMHCFKDAIFNIYLTLLFTFIFAEVRFYIVSRAHHVDCWPAVQILTILTDPTTN